MKIVCVGGGPTGTYFAILAKLRDARHEVTVIERNAPGATHGWGVAWGDELLDALYAHDPDTGHRLRAAACSWNGQKVYVGDHPVVHLGGRYGYSINRARMQDILTGRARELDVDLRFGETVESEADLDADLVVAADGVGSRLRAGHAAHFGTTFTPGHNRCLWLGTSKVFDTFQWRFRPTEAGWVWCWIYASAECSSTVIVECTAQTWAGLGFDVLDHDAQLRRIEEIFADALDGHPLMDPPVASTPSEWVVFREIRNRTWHHGRLVLAGDAAHTTHFSIGSGTSLGLQDAITLARLVLEPGAAVTGALAAFSRTRRAEVERIQEAALLSMRWFEDADARLDDDPVKIAYSLFDRRGDQAPWRYQVHLATQIAPLTQVRKGITSARRSVRARRRELH